jgi:hypothetical protein
VSARCVLTESILTQNFRRDNLKLCLHRSVEDLARCVQEETHSTSYGLGGTIESCKELLKGVHNHPQRS